MTKNTKNSFPYRLDIQYFAEGGDGTDKTAGAGAGTNPDQKELDKKTEFTKEQQEMVNSLIAEAKREAEKKALEKASKDPEKVKELEAKLAQYEAEKKKAELDAQISNTMTAEKFIEKNVKDAYKSIVKQTLQVHYKIDYKTAKSDDIQKAFESMFKDYPDFFVKGSGTMTIESAPKGGAIQQPAVSQKGTDLVVEINGIKYAYESKDAGEVQRVSTYLKHIFDPKSMPDPKATIKK